MSGFNFGRLGSLVQSVQSTIKTVESSIDRAMGTDEQSLAASTTTTTTLNQPQQSTNTSAVSTTTSSTSAYPTPSRVDVNRFVADTTGDFFSSFGGDGFAPPILTPSKRNITSTPSTPATATTPSSSTSWDLHSLTSAARSILPSTPSSALKTPETASTVNLPVAHSSNGRAAVTRSLSPVATPPLREEEKKEREDTEAADEENEEVGWGQDDIDLPVEVQQPEEETKQQADTQQTAAGKEDEEEVKDRRDERHDDRDAIQAREAGNEEQAGWSMARSVSSHKLAANSFASFFPSKEEREQADEDEQSREERSREEQPQPAAQTEEQRQQHHADFEPSQHEEASEQADATSRDVTRNTIVSETQPETVSTDSTPPSDDVDTAPPATVQSSSSTSSSHPFSSASTPPLSTPASPQTQPTPSSSAASVPTLPPTSSASPADSSTPPTVIESPLASTISSAPSVHSASSNPSPAIPSSALSSSQTFTATPIVLPSSSTTTSTMEELLKRCETAELISNKLNRLVKIRELQLEKLQLEHSATNNFYQTTLAKLNDTQRELDRQQAAVVEERRQKDVLRDERDRLRGVRDASEAGVEVVKAKDAQIEAVMREGQQLMQKQSSLETIIKKLRKDLADKDKQTDDDRQANQRLQAALDKLRDEVREEKEKREKAEESVSVLTHSIDEVGSKYNELLAQQRTLETHTTEYALELERVKDERRAKEREVEGLRGELQALVEVKREKDAVLASMKDSHLNSSQREESLLRSVHELQLAAKREEEARVVREESLQYELRMVRDQLREAEKRNEELSGAVPAATRPLLRQIESLRSMMAEQGEVAVKVESELRGRVKDLEKEVARERRDRHAMDEAKHRMEMEVNEREQTVRQLKERLAAAETASRQAKRTQEQLQTELSAAEERAEQMVADVQTTKRERDEVEAKLRRALEEKKAAELKQQAASTAEKDARQRLEAHIEQSKTSVNGTNAAATASSVQSIPESPSYATASPTSASHFVFPASPASSSSSYLQLTSSSSDRSALTATSELLRSLLRQKEGELLSVREQLHAANRQRDDLSERLIADEAELTRLKRRGELLDEREKDLAVMRVRYDAALQLIGEKEDELDELHSDMQHVKQLFRQQIEHIMATQQSTAQPGKKANGSSSSGSSAAG